MKERLDGRISIALPTRHTSWYYQKVPVEKQAIRDKIRVFLEHLWLIEHGGDSEEQIIRRKLADAQNREQQLMQEYSQAQSERQAYETYLERLAKDDDSTVEKLTKDLDAFRKGPMRFVEL